MTEDLFLDKSHMGTLFERKKKIHTIFFSVTGPTIFDRTDKKNGIRVGFYMTKHLLVLCLTETNPRIPTPTIAAHTKKFDIFPTNKYLYEITNFVTHFWKKVFYAHKTYPPESKTKKMRFVELGQNYYSGNLLLFDFLCVQFFTEEST